MAPSAESYPITGIQDDLGPKEDALRKVPLRMEVDDWFTSDKLAHVNQRALFFPALMRFSQMDPREKTSWYQIAGIHGKPYVPWDEGYRVGKTPNEGYCTHASVLFTTWHRAYMLLWEQAIYELMKEEVNKFDEADRPELLEAAKTWRFPYWDWALKKEVAEGVYNYDVPQVIKLETVNIRLPGPHRTEGEYPNAFYQFTMPGRIPMGHKSLASKDKNPKTDLRITGSKVDLSVATVMDETTIIPFDKCTATSRHPKPEYTVSGEWTEGKQNWKSIVAMLRDYPFDKGDPRSGNMGASLRDAFYRLLTIEKFEDFASKRFPDGVDKVEQVEKRADYAYDSAEHLHDVMHLFCGGFPTPPDKKGNALLGHMSHVPMAAFDPIFWLHHCNVDRLFAIWQVLNKKNDTWFDGSDSRDEDPGNYGLPTGNLDEPDDFLRPFHKSADGSYFTSTDVREVAPLGYTYPLLEKWENLDAEGKYDNDLHVRKLAPVLNSNYNSSWDAWQRSKLTEHGEASASVSELLIAKGLGECDYHELTAQPDYVVNVVYERMALDGKMFTIHIFLGDVPEILPPDPSCVNLVGQVFNFSAAVEINEAGAGCGNCIRLQADKTKTTGRIVLTNSLITRWKHQQDTIEGESGSLASMDPEDVIPYLKDNLDWRVTCMGQPVTNIRRDISSLKISVAVGRADHYKDTTKMSKFYEYKGAYEVTQGRAGGAKPSDLLYPPQSIYR